MPRRPHYIPGQSAEKTCKVCGLTMPVSQFYVHSSQKGYRQPCKDCWNERKRGGNMSGYSTCTNCEQLELCVQILWDIVPLPCQDANFRAPKSAAWVGVRV